MDSARSAFDSIADLHSGSVTAATLAAQALDRIEQIDATGYELNSVLALAPKITAADFDLALPLAGLPILIKDNIEALGLPATAGSTALLDHPVTADSQLVARLRAAGANIIGATNLSEWANIRSTLSLIHI